jgi:hypothetical protein
VRAAVLAASLAAITSACSGGSAEPGEGSADDAGIDSGNPYGGADSVPGDEIVHTYAPTYAAVWNEVLRPNCALIFCHAGSADYLQLSSEAIGYESLVDAAAEGPMCSKTGLLRVDPYHPDASLMYLKITTPPCGNKMPFLPGNPSLDPRDVAQIRQWISCGALDGDAGCPVEAGADADGADAADAAAIDATANASPD